METSGATHVASPETADYSNKIKRVASLASPTHAGQVRRVRFSASGHAVPRNVRIISAP